MAVQDRYYTDLIVYTLGRIAIDDFSELMVLGGNGWGIGALKILRGMYERVVNRDISRRILNHRDNSREKFGFTGGRFGIGQLG